MGLKQKAKAEGGDKAKAKSRILGISYISEAKTTAEAKAGARAAAEEEETT